MDMTLINTTGSMQVVCPYLAAVTQARVVCLICTPEGRRPRAEGGHIRQTTSACVTTIM